MGSNPKGHALILNINKVKGKDERMGSDVDVINLQKLFHGLGYIIQLEVDSTDKVNMIQYLFNFLELFFVFLFIEGNQKKY